MIRVKRRAARRVGVGWVGGWSSRVARGEWETWGGGCGGGGGGGVGGCGGGDGRGKEDGAKKKKDKKGEKDAPFLLRGRDLNAARAYKRDLNPGLRARQVRACGCTFLNLGLRLLLCSRPA
jgi:hypothetical protein